MYTILLLIFTHSSLDAISALPLQFKDDRAIKDLLSNQYTQVLNHDESNKLERRGIMNKLKSAGNSAADLFRTKSQKQANAMKDVLDSHKHVTPKTLIVLQKYVMKQ